MGTPTFSRGFVVNEMSFPQPTEAQKVCLLRHNKDQASARSFIDEHWREQPVQSSGKNSRVSYTVSTTLKSSVLLLAVDGPNSSITRNTYSEGKDNPWLIYGDMVVNLNLANDVREKWANMQVPEGKREEVDQIIPHVVYSFRDERCWCWRWCWRWWELVPLTCDDSATVKVVAGNLKIYSHPARDGALESALKNQDKFGQVEGHVKKEVKQWHKISQNGQIPESIKEERLKEQVKKVGERFMAFYDVFYLKFYADARNIPESYKGPTLQLKLLSDEEGNQEQRYGGGSSGVHGSTDNEVHHPFAAAHVQPRPLPQVPEAKTVYEELQAECTSTLNYDMILAAM